MTELENTGNTEEVLRRIEQIEDCYKDQTRLFTRFLREKSLSFDKEGIESYIQYLNQEHGGKRFAASTFNVKLNMVKARVKFLLENSADNLDELKMAILEKYLLSLKSKKINSVAVSEDDILTFNEMQKLILEAGKRLGMMIEFLRYTGCRVSEMLNVLITDCKNGKENVTIKLQGKGSKEREVRIDKKIYQRIKDEFETKNQTYLFEHDGKQYSRNALTIRIKHLSEKVLGKSATAHTIRHSFATVACKKWGLKLTSVYLGHSNITTTATIYDKNKVRWQNVRDLFSEWESEK